MTNYIPYIRRPSAKRKKEVTEMSKLMKLLDEANVPYEVQDCWGTPQVCYPKSGEGQVCDAICHGFSYGHEEGLLEIMGLGDEEAIGDSVEGYLTAEEVATRIIAHHQQRR